MAESKPTKLQMAKEIQYLIAAAQDMSAVMDLDPPIKWDYLIDLKNKTVTVSHLNQVVSSLQADIKRDAKEIESTDKFQPDTHKVLADLNIKVPRPAAKEEVVEDDEELETTASPDAAEIEEAEEVSEKEKPIKKVKKNAAGTTEKIKKEKDKFGFKIGSIISNLALGLENNPMTMKEIKEASFNNGREQYGNLKKFIEMGIGVKTEDGKIMVEAK